MREKMHCISTYNVRTYFHSIGLVWFEMNNTHFQTINFHLQFLLLLRLLCTIFLAFKGTSVCIVFQLLAFRERYFKHTLMLRRIKDFFEVKEKHAKRLLKLVSLISWVTLWMWSAFEKVLRNPTYFILCLDSHAVYSKYGCKLFPWKYTNGKAIRLVYNFCRFFLSLLLCCRTVCCSLPIFRNSVISEYFNKHICNSVFYPVISCFAYFYNENVANLSCTVMCNTSFESLFSRIQMSYCSHQEMLIAGFLGNR